MKNDNKHIDKKIFKDKKRNSKRFSNISKINDDGVLILKNKKVACVLELTSVDLSLSGKSEREAFFSMFKEIYKINNLHMKCIKLDKKINLNMNKEHYLSLIDKFKDYDNKVNLLTEEYDLINYLEEENCTLSSSYYIVLIADTVEIINKQIDDIKYICDSTIPRVFIDLIKNRLELYTILVNFYYSNADLEQIMWYDLPDLISPSYLEEKSNMLKIDDKEVQMITIKNVPPFIDEMFFERIFNYPNVKACINVSDTIETDSLVRNLDSSYKFLLTDRNTTKKLSDATVLDTEKEKFQILMNDIKNGNEIVKEVSMILAIEGTEKERNDIFNDLKNLAKPYYLKLEIAKLRQLELWNSFDITGISLKDYSFFLPSLTLAIGFPFTQNYFNDYTGYYLGYDTHSSLPTFFNPFYLNKKSRTSHNIAIVASTGSGKSYTMKKIIVNEFARGSKIFILDAEGEYENLVLKNKGAYIDLYSRKYGVINPLQLRYIPNDNDNSPNNEIYPLPKHLGFLETFYKNAFDDIKEKELVMLLSITESLYKKYGIYKNTTISELEKIKNTDYPIFEDLLAFISEYKQNIHNKEKIEIINQLEILLERFLTGTDSYLFNGHTTIDLSNDLIAFDLRDLLYCDNKRLINTQIINLLTYLNNSVVSNKILNDKLESKDKRPLCIVVDEFHLYINEDNLEVLRNLGQLARRIRKYYGSVIVSTQSIEDFVGSENIIRHAKAIFNNCQYQMVGMMKETDLNAYLEIFKENPLTDTQKEFLLQASMGEFLLSITNKKRLRIKISATTLEEELMGEIK